MALIFRPSASVASAAYRKLITPSVALRLFSAYSECRLVKFDPRAKSKSKKGVVGSKYGGWTAAAMIPGHGIGPELCQHVEDTFVVSGVPVYFEKIKVDTSKESNDELDEVMNSIKRNGVAIKGVKSRHKNVNIFIIRQNTEGEYSNMEHEVIPGVVDSLKLITRKNSERIARYAFDFAQRTGRKKVTTVHKANIMKLSDGLFLEVSKEIAKEYPDIEHNDMIIDNCCMQLVSNPHQFDVMLMPNLYGTIISNVICGLIGGPGLLSGCNYGDGYAVFEPGARSSGSGIAGKNMANPIAMLNASVDLLRHLGLDGHSKQIQAAIHNVVNVEKVHTIDLGGSATPKQVMESIFNYIKAHPVQVLGHE